MGVAFFMNNEHDNEAHKANAFVMHMKNTSYFNSTLLYRQSCEEQEAGAALLRSKTQKNDQKAGN